MKRTLLLVVVNVSVFVVLIAVLELAAGLALSLRESRPSIRWPDGYARADALLGQRRLPNDTSVIEKYAGDGSLIYRHSDTSDSLGWRVVPGTPERDRFVAFFGGSYTYGAGIGDTEHLAAHFARIQDRYRPHSLSFGGWGPSHFLALMESGVPLGIEADTGVAVFTFIASHTDRVQGSFDIAAPGRWGQGHPLYVPAGDSMAFVGPMTRARPVRARVFGALAQLHMVEFFAPRARFTRRDPTLSSKVLSQACRRFAERFTSLGCYVVLYPSTDPDAELPPGDYTILDLRGLFDRSTRRYAIHPPVDGHPTAEAIRAIADTLTVLLP